MADDIGLTISYSNNAWETFIEGLRWPIDKGYNAKLTLTDGTEFDVQLCKSLVGDAGDGVRFRRRAEIDGLDYVADSSDFIAVWHDTEPYLKAVHIY